jgi:hypothetical protein
MRIVCTGWQGETQQAVLTTKHTALFFGRGLAVSRIWRKMPDGSVDLVEPVLVHITLLAREQDAEAQHRDLWFALRHDGLPPEVKGRLFPADTISPSYTTQVGPTERNLN